MPDKRSRRKQIDRRRWLDNPRRMRLYADEDMAPWAVEVLRAGGTNVLTTHEAGNAGKDNRFQMAFAARKRRVLITRNVKHFLDDRLLPLRATRGVIALDVNVNSAESYLSALAITTEFVVPWSEPYEDMKIRISSAGGTLRYVDRTGATQTVSFSVDELFEGRYPTDSERVA